MKKTKTPILEAYTALNSVSKEIVRNKVQNALGCSTASIYNKFADESGLNQIETEAIKKIIAEELKQSIAFNTNHLNNLLNETYERK
jgi:4-diphosphocytidyl-2C-methyl-D-erythritol kinase